MIRYRRNLLVIFIICLASVASAATGLRYPNAMHSVTDTTITALSIIFGLSMAVFSLSSGRINELPEKRPPDPLVARQITDKINRDNQLTTERQKLLMGLFLISVILGVSFKVATKIPEFSNFVPFISALFAFFGTASLLSAFFLPNLLSKLHQRNQHFGIK